MKRIATFFDISTRRSSNIVFATSETDAISNTAWDKKKFTRCKTRLNWLRDSGVSNAKSLALPNHIPYEKECVKEDSIAYSSVIWRLHLFCSFGTARRGKTWMAYTEFYMLFEKRETFSRRLSHDVGQLNARVDSADKSHVSAEGAADGRG